MWWTMSLLSVSALYLLLLSIRALIDGVYVSACHSNCTHTTNPSRRSEITSLDGVWMCYTYLDGERLEPDKAVIFDGRYQCHVERSETWVPGIRSWIVLDDAFQRCVDRSQLDLSGDVSLASRDLLRDIPPCNTT